MGQAALMGPASLPVGGSCSHCACGRWGGLIAGLVWMAAVLVFAMRRGGGLWKWVGGMGAGLAVAGAWGFSAQAAASSFDVVPLQGVTFSGPSAERMMRVLAVPASEVGFHFGLLPGVFVGSFVGAGSGR